MNMHCSFRRVVVVLIVSSSFVFSGCVREESAVTGKTRGYGYSWNQELEIGRESDAQVIEQFGLYDDAKVQAYVQAVGERVAGKSQFGEEDAPDLYRETQFTFRVLDSPVVNALALPGGYIYVTRGLLTHLNNEAQLAVVLGHEIGHVVARHASQQAHKAQIGQLGLLAGAILGQAVLGDAGGNLMNLGGGAFELLLLKYSRDAEREADRLGLEYAARKGYEVAEGSAFFMTLNRLREREGAGLPNWQSTHPDPGQREETVNQLARAYERPQDMKVIGQDALFAILEGLVLGENPREGFVQDNTFYHPELRFQFPVPTGWKVNNERAAILMMEPKRQALMIVELAPAKTAREAASKLANAQGVRVVNTQDTRVNGLTAVVLTAQANTKQGVAGLLNYLIEYDGKVYSLLGYTAAAHLNAASPTFEKAMRGFGPLRDGRLLTVQPARVQVITASASAPFNSFIPAQASVAGLTANDLAILNQVDLDTIVPAGARLKVPSIQGEPMGTPLRQRISK